MREIITRAVLLNSIEFKGFWKEIGPFKYALTSMDFPPVMMEQEEWIFSNDMTLLLKNLMQFEVRKMKIVQAAFNPENRRILRPEKLIPWKISNFPEEWNILSCDLFMPEGHLTENVMKRLESDKKKADAKSIESAFFLSLEFSIDRIGYLLFKPESGSKYAGIQKYLAEWEKDDRDAGVY